MARLPSREEIRRSKVREAKLGPRRLKALGIDVDQFDSLLARLEKVHALEKLAQSRTHIIRDTFRFWQEVAGAKPGALGNFWPNRRPASEQLRVAIANLRSFARSFPKDPMPRLLHLRQKWSEADPLGEESLWGDLIFHCSEYGLGFMDWRNRFFVYPWPDRHEFLAEPETVPNATNLQSVVRARLRAACLATIKDWTSGYGIQRGRPAYAPLHEWIVCMANLFVEMGGQLKSPWASFSGTFRRHHSEFADFLLPFYLLLPRQCRVTSEDSFTQHIETAENALKSGELDELVLPFDHKLHR